MTFSDDDIRRDQATYYKNQAERVERFNRNERVGQKVLPVALAFGVIIVAAVMFIGARVVLPMFQEVKETREQVQTGVDDARRQSEDIRKQVDEIQKGVGEAREEARQVQEESRRRLGEAQDEFEKNLGEVNEFQDQVQKQLGD